jgi:hypothetical protein
LDGFGPGATLGRKVKNSYGVIETLGTIEITRNGLEAAATVSLMDSPDDLTLGLITILNAKFGNEAAKDWIIGARLAHPLSDRAVARLLTALPDDRGTWTFAKELGSDVEGEYWLTKGAYWLKGSKDDLLIAIDAYLHFGRGMAALEASLQRLSEVPSGTILEMLEAVFRNLNSSQGWTMVTYEVEQAFKALDNRTDLSDEDIARREIMFFPLLGSIPSTGCASLTLWRKVRTSISKF